MALWLELHETLSWPSWVVLYSLNFLPVFFILTDHLRFCINFSASAEQDLNTSYEHPASLQCYQLWIATLANFMPRYTRVAGREGAPAFHHDRSVDQPEGAASCRPWWAKKDGRLAAGEAETTDGAGQAAAGAGRKGPWMCLGLYNESWVKRKKKTTLILIVYMCWSMCRIMNRVWWYESHIVHSCVFMQGCI